MMFISYIPYFFKRDLFLFLFFFFSLFFRLMTDLYVPLRHKQVYVSLLADNKK